MYVCMYIRYASKVTLILARFECECLDEVSVNEWHLARDFSEGQIEYARQALKAIMM